MKTTPTVLQLVRLVVAYTGEKYYQMLERVLREELAKQQATTKI